VTPANSAASLSSITRTTTQLFETPGWWHQEIQTHDFSKPAGTGDHYIELFGTAATLTRTGSATATSQLLLGTGLQNNNIRIFDAALDFQYKLILTLRVDLRFGGIPQPTVSLIGQIASKTYNRYEQPPGTIQTETGDPSATNQQCVLDGTVLSFGSSDADADLYAVVVNSTDGVVLWSAIDPSPNLSEDVRSTDNFAGSQYFQNLDIPAGAFDTNPQHNDFTVTGQQLPNYAPTLNPTSLTPPAGATLIPINLYSHAFRTLYAFARSGLEFLNLPPLSGVTIPASTVKYSSGTVALGDATSQAALGTAALLAAQLTHGRLPSPFRARDVYRNEWTGLTEPRVVQGALEGLAELGWLRAEAVRIPDGGRPSMRFHINPRVAAGAAGAGRAGRGPKVDR
jgi:hypothetical protein